jgi:hypothetical protein
MTRRRGWFEDCRGGCYNRSLWILRL